MVARARFRARRCCALQSALIKRLPQLKKLSPDEYKALRTGAVLIEADPSGEKVLRLEDGSFLKLFRRKRLISSALLKPPALRFAMNAAKLAELGIPCPCVLDTCELPQPGLSAVRYAPLPGRTLRDTLVDAEESARPAFILRLAEFVARLHELGIYFRSLHMGNVIVTPQDELGLIDFLDMRIGRKPLSRQKRLRNFRHVLRYKRDIEMIRRNGAQEFFETYNHRSPVRIPATLL